MAQSIKDPLSSLIKYVDGRLGDDPTGPFKCASIEATGDIICDGKFKGDVYCSSGSVNTDTVTCNAITSYGNSITLGNKNLSNVGTMTASSMKVIQSSTTSSGISCLSNPSDTTGTCSISIGPSSYSPFTNTTINANYMYGLHLMGNRFTQGVSCLDLVLSGGKWNGGVYIPNPIAQVRHGATSFEPAVPTTTVGCASSSIGTTTPLGSTNYGWYQVFAQSQTDSTTGPGFVFSSLPTTNDNASISRSTSSGVTITSVNTAASSSASYDLAFTSGYDATHKSTFGVEHGTYNFGPGASIASWNLGSISHPWNDIYSTNSHAGPSDRREKEEIKTSELGLEFVNKLRPVSYKWKARDYETNEDGTVVPISGVRRHYGLIAQEVKDVLDEMKIDTNDFAGYIYDEKSDRYAIRYGEFIPPIIKSIQELSVSKNKFTINIDSEGNEISVPHNIQSSSITGFDAVMKTDVGLISRSSCLDGYQFEVTIDDVNIVVRPIGNKIYDTVCFVTIRLD